VSDGVSDIETSWDPAQYGRFAGEREQPFWDLAALVERVDRPSLVDLGCGDARLTHELHLQLGARHTIGIDSSPAMLAAAAANAGAGVDVAAGDLAAWQGADVDVVVSNAALHWVPDHASVLARWTASLATGGQLAVQMPSNADHASHRVARRLAAEWMGADAPPDPVDVNVRPPEEYATVLHDLGFARQHVRLQVYGHRLDRTTDVVEWVKGSSLTRFAAVLDRGDYERFVDEYTTRLVAELGDRSPYFYTFKRILLWGRRA
jgi:trans-aconitate 2-methyltransferase